jgi:peroxiredoxin
MIIHPKNEVNIMTEHKAIEIGTKAPDFGLKDQNNQEFILSDYIGKRVLLSFHPLAWTGVCARQMKALDENFVRFQQFNVIPVGLSVDSVPSKKAWAESLGLKQLRLLADFWEHGEIAKRFHIFIDKLGTSGRGNILIDENGTVEWVKVYEVSELPNLDEVFKVLNK